MKLYSWRPIHIALFTLLSVIMLFRVVPKVQRSGVRAPSAYLTPYSVFFNEEYLNDPHSGLTNANLYRNGFDSYSEHHLFTPVYRALKTGKHLSNMGYNDSRPEFFDFPNIETNNPHFYDYKGMYLSSFNNITEIFYFFLPQELKHMTNVAQEFQIAHYTSNFRYAMGGFHIIGYILIFGILLYRFGFFIAWGFGAAVLINPLNFFLALSLIGFPASSLLLFVPVLYFYPNPKGKLFSKKYMYMAVCFTLINTFLLWISQPLSSLFLTWAVAIAFAFALDLAYSFQEGDFLKTLGQIILRTGLLAIVSLLPLFPIYMVELTQQAQWLDLSTAEVLKASLNRVANTRYNSVFIPAEAGHQISSLKDWAWHIGKGIYYNLIYPTTAPFFWLPAMGIPRVLFTIRLIYVLILFGLFQLYLFSKGKLIPAYRTYISCCLIFGCSYVLYFLGFHLASPRLASHVRVIAPIFSFYQTILIVSMGCFGIKILRQNKG